MDESSDQIYSDKSFQNGKIDVEEFSIYWERYGRGPNVALCIAGVLGDVTSDFHEVWGKMDTSKFTLIGIDMPGYGNSRPPERDYCIEEHIYVRDARVGKKLMEKLGYQSFSIIGHSGGGWCGILMAGLFPEAVEKVVACNAPICVDKHLAKVVPSMARISSWVPFKRNYCLKKYGKEYAEKVLASWIRYILGEVDEQKHQPILEEIYASVSKTPILYIQGLKDIVVSPDTALKTKKFIPHTRIHEVRGGDHLHFTFLNEFVRVAQQFILN